MRTNAVVVEDTQRRGTHAPAGTIAVTVTTVVCEVADRTVCTRRECDTLYIDSWCTVAWGVHGDADGVDKVEPTELTTSSMEAEPDCAADGVPTLCADTTTISILSVSLTTVLTSVLDSSPPTSTGTFLLESKPSVVRDCGPTSTSVKSDPIGFVVVTVVDGAVWAETPVPMIVTVLALVVVVSTVVRAPSVSSSSSELVTPVPASTYSETSSSLPAVALLPSTAAGCCAGCDPVVCNKGTFTTPW
eukprot:m.221222 g.221222  ORF g.221222 m.221222 type:complete len:246 (-) comp31843_c0_seq1:144-881(-)